MTSTEKRKILIFVDWYLPAYKAGGPVKSIAAIINRLSDEFDFSIVTGDRDFGSDHAFRDVEFDKWTLAPDGARIWYSRLGSDRKCVFKKILSEESFDTCYFNGAFSRDFTLMPLKLAQKLYANRSIIIAPRGMFGEGALKIKRLKKKLFLIAARNFGIYDDVIWHVSSAQEADEVKGVIGQSAETVVAPNLAINSGVNLSGRKKFVGQLNIVFISRISVKKNLDYAIDVLKEVQNTDIFFSIYGPEEDRDYVQLCKQKLANSPDHLKYKFCGELNPSDLHFAYKDAHVFVLPTIHENFGHVILESLSMACPVIISDQTPWDAIDNSEAGWVLPLSDKAAFVQTIERLGAMTQEEFHGFEVRALKCAEAYFRNDENLKANRELLRS